jgi:hypothetical protein
MSGGVRKAAVFRPSAVAMATKLGDEDADKQHWRTMLTEDDENDISNLDVTAFDLAAERDRMRREAIEHSRTLGTHYNAFVSTALAEKLASVKIHDDQRVEVALRDGGKLMDEGPRIKVGTGSDSEIGAVLDLARAKRWQALAIRGNDQFVWRATIAALQDGRLPPDKIQAGRPEQEHVVADAKRRFAEGMKLQQTQTEEGLAKLNELIKHRELPSMKSWHDAADSTLTSKSAGPTRRKAFA